MIAGLTSPSLRGARMWFLCLLRFQKLQLLATPRIEVNLARKLGAEATAFGEMLTPTVAPLRPSRNILQQI